MADWKERGYVPDSEDEDEDADYLASALPTQDKAATIRPLYGQEKDLDSGKIDRLNGQKAHQSSQIDGGLTVHRLDHVLSQGLRTVREALSLGGHGAANDTLDVEDDDSPLSSLPSSLSSSPLLKPLDSASLPLPFDSNGYDEVDHVTESRLSSRRNLRMRNPIQLHPYMLEDAQYRNLMKARGLKPVNLPNQALQTELLPSETQNSQDVDLVGTLPSNGAQSLEVASSPVSGLDNDESQSPIARARRTLPDDDIDLEDDLPDLSQILQQGTGFRKRSHKGRHRVEKDANGRDHRNHLNWNIAAPNPNQYGRDSAIDYPIDGFQVPPSPPWSDSPSIPRNVDPTGRHESRHVVTPAALPTPLVSSDNNARKRPTSAISISTSASSESDISHDSEPEDRRDDSQGIQVMTKRIRGVLPASWLRLDMKQKSKANEGMKLHHSPSKAQDDKGVARRIASKSGWTTQIRGTTGRHSFDLGDDESSDDNNVGQVNQSRYSLQLPIANPGLQYGDEAEEDNAIDYMLPAQPRKRVASGTIRRKQQRIDQSWRETTARGGKDQQWTTATKSSGRTGQSTGGVRRKRQRNNIRRDDSEAMDILDAPMLHHLQKDFQPRFLKVAARRARHGSNKNALLVVQKFFRLSTTQETREIAGVIDNWKSNSRDAFMRSSPAGKLAAHAETAADIPSLHEKTSMAVQNNYSHGLDDLKQSTDALLRRVSLAKLNAKRLQADDYQNTEPYSSSSSNLKATAAAATAQLRSLFPHRNRSGRGQLLSRLNAVRPAQIEEERKTSSRTPASATQRIPKRLSKAAALYQRSQQVTNGPDSLLSDLGGRRQEDTTTANGISTKSRNKLPRKQQPRRRETETLPTIASTIAADPLQYDRITNQHIDLTSCNLPESDATAVFESITGQMQHILRSSQIGYYRTGSFVDTTLKRVKHLADHSHGHTELSGRSLTTPQIVTSNTRLVTIGPYNAQAMRDIVEVQSSLLDSTKNWDCRSTSIIDGIEDLIKLTNESLYFPDLRDDKERLPDLPDTLQSFSFHPPNVREKVCGRQHYVHTSLCFVDDMFRYLTSSKFETKIEERQIILTLLTRLAIYSLQLHVLVTDIEPLRQLVKDTLLSVLRQALTMSLDWSMVRTHFYPHAKSTQASQDQEEFSLCGICPERDGIFLCWQVSRMLASQEDQDIFQSLLASSVNRETSHFPFVDLGIRLMTLYYVLDSTTIDGDDEHSPECHSLSKQHHAWDIYLTLIPKVITFIRSSSYGNLSTLSREYMRCVVLFTWRFAQRWQWQATPSLVKILLEVYAFNDMLPYNFTGDVESIFFDHQVIDVVSEHQKTDFNWFLDLVCEVIDSQRLLSQDEFNHKTVAKELRGLVYGLIPNNAQLYDAREELLAEPFLGLKNHFSLYVTLYRSSPEGFGPRIKQLEQQVDLEYSHLMVCKLALKVWETIAVFEVKRVPPNARFLAELGMWLQSIFTQLERRRATGQIDANVLYSEALQKLTICLEAFPATRSISELISPVSSKIKHALPPDSHFGARTAGAALKVLKSCAPKMRKDDECNDCFDSVFSMAKLSLQSILEDEKSSMSLVQTAIASWFAMARAKIEISKGSWHDFIEPRSPFSMDQLGSIEGGKIRDLSKTFFICELVETEKDTVFLEHRSLIMQSWVVALLSPYIATEHVNLLTKHIINYGGESLQLPSLGTSLGSRIDGDQDVRFPIIQHIVQNAYIQKDDPESEWLAGGLEEHDLRDLLWIMNETMKRSWQSLRDDPVAQNTYTTLVEAVVNEMEIYPVPGSKPLPWFSDGKEFPRASQTFDNIFKCRFGAEGGEVSKSAIVTLRVKSIEAFVFRKQPELAAELMRGFCCTDTLRVSVSDLGRLEYSVDILKQTNFLQVVGCSYISQTRDPRGAVVALPLIRCLSHLATNIFFRIDNLDPIRMEKFVDMSLHCLVTVSQVLSYSENTPITSALFKYATSAVRGIWQLTMGNDNVMSEQLQEVFATTVFRLVDAACLRLSGSEVDDMSHLAHHFFTHCSLATNELVMERGERELCHFATSDLKEGFEKMISIPNSTHATNIPEIEKESRAFLDLIQSLPLLPDSTIEEEE